MSTFTQILYQIVFGTFAHERTLTKPGREKLFGYIVGIVQNQKCHCYAIGGVEDHLHIVTHLHPSVALDRLVKDIKLASTEMIKREKLFPMFRGWQAGYGGFTYSIGAKTSLINYARNQEEHHRKKSFREEYIQLLKDHGIEFREEYLFKK